MYVSLCLFLFLLLFSRMVIRMQLISIFQKKLYSFVQTSSNALSSLSLGNMGSSNVNFKLLSLNARGIPTFEKGKAIFSWLRKSGADICFLQETCSTRDVENIWKNQWRSNLFFSHGTCHSRGVLVLVKDNLDFNLQTVKTDPEGRYIMLDATIQDSRYRPFSCP